MEDAPYRPPAVDDPNDGSGDARFIVRLIAFGVLIVAGVIFVLLGLVVLMLILALVAR